MGLPDFSSQKTRQKKYNLGDLCVLERSPASAGQAGERTLMHYAFCIAKLEPSITKNTQHAITQFSLAQLVYHCWPVYIPARSP